MSESKMHSGGCHCGNVRYEVEADVGSGMECNCSICSKKGSLLTFVKADKFKVTGEDAQTEYLFNKHKIHHLFCKTCGVQSYARGNMPDGSPMVAINLRCVDGIDLATVKVKQFDGKSL